MRDERRRRSDGFFWGIFLIGIGTLFLLERSGTIPEIYWGRWWPAFVLVGGLARMVRPAHAGHVGSGVTLVLLSGWFLAVIWNWHGLTWTNSWPLALVASGSGMVARAIACRYMPDRGEVFPHV